MFGKDQPISLQILEIPDVVRALEGVAMELQDCAFPLLQGIEIGSDAKKIFKGADYTLLVGAKPRGPGMERGDLLAENGKIFIEQGRAINDVAAEDVKIFVVGNPCNTNCLIAMQNAPRVSKRNFHAMMRLDQNRTAAQIAKKADVDISDVGGIIVWGNHSATQVPDLFNARIQGKPLFEFIKDEQWLENECVKIVQQRGAAIIAARGKSSAASAASALIDAVKAINTPTPTGQWFSSAVYSSGNNYGIDQNLIFSFPCRSNGNGDCEIVDGLPWDPVLEKRIHLSEKELIEERKIVEPLYAEAK